MKKVLFILCQCSWGILQTALGAALFLVHCRKKHRLYHGAIITEWANPSCVSLGLFLFVTRGSPEELLVHEYGHALQSLILGPLYLFVVGIPSALWCILPCCRRMREKKGVSYYAFYTESWADRLPVVLFREYMV